MPSPENPWQRHQRERWRRHDAHLWTRPDAARFRKTGTDATDVYHALPRKHDAEDAGFAAEIAKGYRLLAVLRAELQPIKAELARRRLERKYSADQPRIPKRNPGGGQFARLGGGNAQSPSAGIARPMGDIDVGDAASGDDTSGLLHITITPSEPDGEGVQLAGNLQDDPGNTPSDDPAPKIPRQVPDTREGRVSFVRAAARWAGRQLSRYAPAVDAYFEALDQVHQIKALTDAIKSANDPAKTLEELRARVSPRSEPGYHDHHIVGQHAGNRAQFGDSRIDNRENRVRIPVLKHIDISAWYQTGNKDFGYLSPRDYLRDKSWDEQMRVGLGVLRDYKVLK